MLKEQYGFKTVVMIGDGATDLEACPPAVSVHIVSNAAFTSSSDGPISRVTGNNMEATKKMCCIAQSS